MARKQWGGNKTPKGADTAAVLASVLRTAAQQGTDPVAVLTEVQRTKAVASQLRFDSTGRSP